MTFFWGGNQDTIALGGICIVGGCWPGCQLYYLWYNITNCYITSNLYSEKRYAVLHVPAALCRLGTGSFAQEFELAVATVGRVWLGGALVQMSRQSLCPGVAQAVLLFRQFEVLTRGIVSESMFRFSRSRSSTHHGPG